ncbi:hypothetical protein ACQEU5_16120 [Marinactinospora thermotolerans]|uniref:Uncharacterized protein n=1 Tax=Marinactinospora thermotolerans DSM 45154 TaxID=1122192 RepID=A0A1T4SMV1_9ACTN|nr:hypothetical protein [Marinactinospora thermotolerans]SKA29483.1 hypothetical protein SAMN02745673_03721 [Marinactinospora thermotolerans DSM 45154]
MLKTYPVGDLRQVTTRLHAEFSALSHQRVERCVADTWRCAEHLGFDVTPGLVERVAREHLQAMVKSEPPSNLGSTVVPGSGPHGRTG